ncbi:MAG: hypothetical protein HY320_08520 [Armatimonadetes bacterium]|nr:hypothetical protein [Armatimonadota bacterium]
MPRVRPPWAWLLIALSAGVAIPKAFAVAAPAPAAETLERLKVAEAALKSGEARYTVATRTVTWDGDVDAQAALDRLARQGRSFGQTAARLRFTGDAWRVDAEFTPAAADGVRQVTQLGGTEGIRRTVQWVGENLYGRVEPDGGSGALPTLESVLRGRLWWDLQAIEWQDAAVARDGVLLRGTKGRRQVEVLLDPKLGHRPTTILLLSRNTDGETTVIQSLRITYSTVDGIPYPSGVAQLFVGRLGERAQATLHELRVAEAQLNGAVAEAELKIVPPRGTLVTDVRAEIPILYNLTDHELTAAEVRERAAAKIAGLGAQDLTPEGGPAVGKPGPAFTLPDLDGKPVKRDDLRGKVVLLNWFASW